MSTYAESPSKTPEFEAMSYDELSAYVDSGNCAYIDWADLLEVQARKSGAMDAICKLAAEMDAEGWVVVPKFATAEMRRIGTDARWRSPVRDADNVLEIWGHMIAAAPPLTREA